MSRLTIAKRRIFTGENQAEAGPGSRVSDFAIRLSRFEAVGFVQGLSVAGLDPPAFSPTFRPAMRRIFTGENESVGVKR
jgi:hypothetical protein